MVDAVRVFKERDHLVVQVPYSPANLARCRELPGRRWNAERRSWTCLATPAAAHKIVELWGEGNVESVDDGFDALLREDQRVSDAQALKTENFQGGDLPEAKTAPWRHQLQAFAFARQLPATMLAMQMGTGKTKVIVDLICAEPKIQRVLVLCPLSVVPVWPSEVLKHAWPSRQIDCLSMDDRLSVVKKDKLAREWIYATRSLHTVMMVVVNYESAWRSPLGDLLLGTAWDLVVCDESHRIKSPGGKASLFCKRLRKVAKKRICLTGTPMPHSPLDIYGQYRFLDPGIFGESKTQFWARYAIMGGKLNSFGRPVQVMGFQNQDELKEKMHRIAFVVKAADVLDLPPWTLTERFFNLSVEERRVYKELERNLVAEVKSGVVTASNALVKLLRLQQLTGGYVTVEHETGEGLIESNVVKVGTSKRELLVEVLEDIGSAEPTVVFCRFRADLHTVEEVSRQLGLVYRELSGERKELGGAIWKDGDVLGAQIQAGGLGVDLTRARYCLFYSVGFSLGDYEQARARVHRPGQDRPVTYVHLVAKGTVDEKVYAALAAKREVVDYVLSRMVKEVGEWTSTSVGSGSMSP